MSGICGLFHPDNAPVSEADLGAMVSMLESRGPDGTGRWQDGPIGLGHTMLATTPESLHEPQPFRHAESGCVITADVRLDYRDELIRSLGLENRELVGDAELIVESYLKCGEACLDHIYGDFAFALWDPREQMLFCARDRFGARPFYHHLAQGQRFVFASDARAILVLPQVPLAHNEGRIADFIVGALEWVDYTSTFYIGIRRLPPAHKLIVTRTTARVEEYWAAQLGPELSLSTDAEYREGFLEVFSRAVAERIRVPDRAVGSMLSGGMDSGSITAVAHGLLSNSGEGPLRTYSLARKRGSDCLESQRIYASLDYLGLSGTQIMADDPASLIDDMGSNLEEPFDGEILFLRAIYEAARRDGVRVVLDGAVSDIVFSASGYIPRLLRRGNFRAAWREVVGESEIWGGRPNSPALLRYMAIAYAPSFVKKPLRRPRRRRRERGWVNDSLISREFAEHVDISARFDRMQDDLGSRQIDDPGLERIRKIRPYLTAGRERYARNAAAASIEGRDPFTDQRLVDFCSRLPDHQLARNGWPKFLLREAMNGKLPDEVRWGQGKPHIGWIYSKNFIDREIMAGRASIESLQSALERYINPDALVRAWNDYSNDSNFHPVHSAYILSRWLGKSVNRPIVKGRGFG